jgi:hypothetical protein
MPGELVFLKKFFQIYKIFTKWQGLHLLNNLISDKKKITTLGYLKFNSLLYFMVSAQVNQAFIKLGFLVG